MNQGANKYPKYKNSQIEELPFNLHKLKSALLICLLAFFISQSCSAQLPVVANHLNQEHLKGNVKSVFQSTYEAIEKYGEINHGELTMATFSTAGNENIDLNTYRFDYDYKAEYNNKGNINTEDRFAPNGELHSRINYFYNENENVIEFLQTNAIGYPWKKTIYKYDANQNCILEHKFTHLGEKLHKRSFAYDKNGNRIEMYFLTKDDRVYSKHNYLYDGSGNRIETTAVDAYGVLKWKKKCNYDIEGNLIEETRYDAKGQFVQQTLYKYNKSHHRIEKRVAYSKSSYFSNYLEKYVYDKNNNLIEIRKYDMQGDLESSERHNYVYDNQNNWVKRIIFKNDKPVYIIEREITYYD